MQTRSHDPNGWVMVWMAEVRRVRGVRGVRRVVRRVREVREVRGVGGVGGVSTSCDYGFVSTGCKSCKN